MNITHPPQTDEQKDASIQLNNIGTINALNTHNRELQQKVMMLNAENERLREALKPFAYNYQDNGLSHSMFIFEMKDLLAAKKALENGDDRQRRNEENGA